jgi:hypothetical protein
MIKKYEKEIRENATFYKMERKTNSSPLALVGSSQGESRCFY